MGTGGGEGAAYAGFLYALHQFEIPVSGICACGTSVFPCLAKDPGHLYFLVHIWKHLCTSGFITDQEAVYEALALLFPALRLENHPARLAVVACDVLTGQPVLIREGSAAAVAASSLWSANGPCIRTVDRRHLSDGSVFGVPVNSAARLFGRPVVALRAARPSKPRVGVSEILIQAAAHRLDDAAELVIDIGLGEGQEDDVNTWFSAGRRKACLWQETLSFMAKEQGT
jgi:NTE family protein